jgi:hypothetical protein
MFAAFGVDEGCFLGAPFLYSPVSLGAMLWFRQLFNGCHHPPQYPNEREQTASLPG